MGIFGNLMAKKEVKEPHLTTVTKDEMTDSHLMPGMAEHKPSVAVKSAENISNTATSSTDPSDRKQDGSSSKSFVNQPNDIKAENSSQEVKKQAPLISVPGRQTPDTISQPITKDVSAKPQVAAHPTSQVQTIAVKEGNKVPIECYPLGKINTVNFSDVYITPDKKTYIWGGKTNNGRNYRVERTIATGGEQFCARKMPTTVPNLRDLGLPTGVYNHLLSLSGSSGLILLAGATGSGKSTTIAALMKEYLSKEGGYAFTIEDPVELPLDGVYVTPNNELGLCKQTVPPEGSWEEGIKSALRSKPRYIYLGEIRSPDIASEALRAATSGHLVLSSIHANNVNEAVNSLVKYAAASGISESMAYELVAGGLLGIVHQILSGAPKRAHVTTIFANPDVNAACQVRGMIRSGKLNMATLMEQQKILLQSNKPLFHVVK